MSIGGGGGGGACSVVAGAIAEESVLPLSPSPFGAQEAAKRPNARANTLNFTSFIKLYNLVV